jgi:hypothetical protein
VSGAQRPSQSDRREALRQLVASGGRKTASAGERRRRTPKPGATADDDRPALQRRSDTKQQQGINFDLALLQYSRDAVTYMQRRHPEEPGVESLAALIDQAIREKIAAWEHKYNDGDALPTL